jgi:hypothetical protein
MRQIAPATPTPATLPRKVTARCRQRGILLNAAAVVLTLAEALDQIQRHDPPAALAD